MQKISRKQAAKECIEFVLWAAEHWEECSESDELIFNRHGLFYPSSEVQGEDEEGLTNGEWFAAMLTTLKGE
tara:strand:+ start:495 stop:710 length:216 start_codon:yes stop_codon:yes gene_type:complete